MNLKCRNAVCFFIKSGPIGTELGPIASLEKKKIPVNNFLFFFQFNL